MTKFVAVGAHIGDVELMCGPTLTQAILDGHDVHIVALTAGEQGHPNKNAEQYKPQKMQEALDFAASIGASLTVFDDQQDAHLLPSPALAERLAKILSTESANIVISHWKGSWHPDHRAAFEITDAALFLATLPRSTYPTPLQRVLYAENWEDSDGFVPEESWKVSDAAFEIWRKAISGHEFARGEATGFRYIDYYTALMTMRGCLADEPRAQSFMPKASSTLVKLNP